MSRSRPKHRQRPPAPGHVPEGERLQKVLAASGLGSRRECEELIATGRVEVDGHSVTELGVRVDASKQQIRVDGQALAQPKTTYYMLNKPKNVVCTNYDPDQRTRVIDLVPGDVRLFTIGRLDRASEGLILITNDGELTNRLAHPRYEVTKTYLVQVAGSPTPEQIAQLQKGVYLAEGMARAERITVRRGHKQSTWLEVVLREGKNREIRRIFARIGHKVLSLKRIAFGPLKLANLPSGAYRPLMKKELDALWKASAEAARRKRPRTGPQRGPRPGALPNDDYDDDVLPNIPIDDDDNVAFDEGQIFTGAVLADDPPPRAPRTERPERQKPSGGRPPHRGRPGKKGPPKGPRGGGRR